MTPNVAHGTPIAYLVSEYPKLSHTFIASEIRGLRMAGMKVDTFSVRLPPPGDLRSTSDQDEATHTTYLIPTVRRQLPALAAFALRHPAMLAVGVWQALRFCSGDARGRRFFYLLEALALVRELSARNIRHIHVHLANNAADVAHLAVAMGRHVDGHPATWSLSVHGPNELSDIRAYNLRRKVSSALFTSCISDYCRSQILMLLPASRWGDVHVVRMGIDPARFGHIDRAQRPETSPTRVLFVGRLVAEKAPQMLVEAIARLPLGEFELRIVGGGPLADQLASDIITNGLEDYVELRGAVNQDEILAQYEWADVFCLPSFAEGLPVVIMEAMSTGLPVISTQIAGIPELVRDGRTGSLVPPGDLDALVEALRAMRSWTTRQALSSDAAALVMQNHTATINAARLADIFSVALAE
ncbi:glycosyltransferase [uncultured Jatrophihabitans sp.]|uniref:glycosyltransferase n=1 Tax=uncultured Jatrophihabitans sp. TaxID=1610747 RepID=UPI0035CCA323